MSEGFNCRVLRRDLGRGVGIGGCYVDKVVSLFLGDRNSERGAGRGRGKEAGVNQSPRKRGLRGARIG